MFRIKLRPTVITSQAIDPPNKATQHNQRVIVPSGKIQASMIATAKKKISTIATREITLEIMSTWRTCLRVTSSF